MAFGQEGETVSFEPVSLQFTTLDGLPSNQVFSSLAMNDGLVLSTAEGITLFDGDAFTNYTSDKTFGAIIKIVPGADSNSVVYFTDQNEIGRFDVITHEFLRYKVPANDVRFTGLINDIHASGDTIWVVDQHSLTEFVVHPDSSLKLLQKEVRVPGTVKLLRKARELMIIPPERDEHVNQIQLEEYGQIKQLLIEDTISMYTRCRVIDFGQQIAFSINYSLYVVDFTSNEVISRDFASKINVLYCSEGDDELVVGFVDRGGYVLDASLANVDSLLSDVPMSSMTDYPDGSVWATSHLQGVYAIPDISLLTVPSDGIASPVIGTIALNQGLLGVDYKGGFSLFQKGGKALSKTTMPSRGIVQYIYPDTVDNGFVVKEDMHYITYVFEQDSLRKTGKASQILRSKFEATDRWVQLANYRLDADSAHTPEESKWFFYVHRKPNGEVVVLEKTEAKQMRDRLSVRLTDSCFVVAAKAGVYQVWVDDEGLHWNEIELEGDAVVMSMQLISPKRILVSTASHGLWLLNKEDLNTPLLWIDADDLNRDKVNYSCWTDSMVYIGTHNGLWIYDASLKSLTKHMVSGLKGMSPLSVNHIAAFHTYMLISTDHGSFALDRSQSKDLGKITREGLQLKHNGVFTQVMGTSIELDFEAASAVDFNIVNSSLINPQVKSYRYRLEPVQTDWTYNQSGEITLGALRPGEYTLYYQSEISKDNWFGQEPRQLSITVTPPFWATWWFYTLGVLMSIGFIWLLVVNRINAAKARKKTKFHALKAQSEALALQLNPHFLFNSFNSTIAYIGSAGNKESIEMLSKLSRLMRKVFYVSEQAFHPLSHEIELVREYLQIEELRFNQSILFHIDTESHVNMEAVHIPVLLLQPIIENSVKHGFAMKEGQLEIYVTIRVSDEHVEIEIWDNGQGIEEELPDDNKRFSSTEAIEKRFKILTELSSETYEVHLKTTSQHGYVTHICIPLNPQTAAFETNAS